MTRKKTKRPSFEVPVPDAGSAATGWVYRSGEEAAPSGAPRVEEPAPVALPRATDQGTAVLETAGTPPRPGRPGLIMQGLSMAAIPVELGLIWILSLGSCGRKR